MTMPRQSTLKNINAEPQRRGDAEENKELFTTDATGILTCTR